MPSGSAAWSIGRARPIYHARLGRSRFLREYRSPHAVLPPAKPRSVGRGGPCFSSANPARWRACQCGQGTANGVNAQFFGELPGDFRVSRADPPNCFAALHRAYWWTHHGANATVSWGGAEPSAGYYRTKCDRASVFADALGFTDLPQRVLQLCVLLSAQQAFVVRFDLFDDPE
jgi:hypothetical protein